MSRPPADASGFAREAVQICLKRPRVAAADVHVKRSRYRRWIRSPEGSASTEAGELGMAVRAFRADGRVGHAFTADVGDPGVLDAAADRAGKMADRCAPEAANLPPGAWEPPDLDLFDPAVESAAAVEGLLTRLEESVREEGRGEVDIESLTCMAGSSQVSLVTSAGFSGSYRATLLTVIVSLRAARGGEVHLDRSVLASRHVSSLDVDRLGRDAARRARLPLDAGTLPPGSLRVALEPRVACTLIEHLAPSLAHDAAERGTSALPAEGAVGPPGVSLVDDASLPRGIASAPFDGEGRPTGAWRLIDGGVLGPLLGAPASRGRRVGSSQRASFADPPRIAPANLHLARGDRGPRAILRDAGIILRVTGASLLGRGGPASGEIVLAASGERMESGEPAGGVRGVTLVGRAGEMLQGILEVANDLSFHLRGGSVGSPTVLLDGMWVA